MSIFDKIVNKRMNLLPNDPKYSNSKMFMHFAGDSRIRKILVTEICGANETLFECTYRMEGLNVMYITKVGDPKRYTWKILFDHSFYETTGMMDLWLYRKDGTIKFKLY